ncbi:hypothetical protein [Bifidobacterium imperatoris]|nr:hypothetical protein [Bifidobacterium imperatoris]
MEEDDNIQDFSCGIPLIDDWAHKRALGAAKHGTAVPYISTTAEGAIAGFYTLSAYSVNRDSVLGGWLRRNTPDRGASFENERVIRSGASPVVSVKS